MEYSIKKGFSKGLVSLVAISGSLFAFAGFSDITIWMLLEQYLKPVLSSLTVGGAITMVLNYLKVKNQV
jgi:hypothetical protein